MRVVIEKSRSGKTFGIVLRNAEDNIYLVIKNCKLAKRKDGTDFVSPPSSKLEDDSWLNHAYISAELQETVLATLNSMELAQESANQAPPQNDPDFLDDDIPFN